MPSTIFEHLLKKFDDIRVKNFNQNGLHNSEELKKSHAMFFQAHDIQLVNEDIGAGILHGDNAYSYDLTPVSSSTGFMNWARKTFDQFLGPIFIPDRRPWLHDHGDHRIDYPNYLKESEILFVEHIHQ